MTVAGGAIEFTVSGRVRVESDAVARVSGGSLEPTAIHFDLE